MHSKVIVVCLLGFFLLTAAEATFDPVEIPERSLNARLPRDLRGFPSGRRTLAGVEWRIPDGRAVMLSGAGSRVEDREIKGIPVGRKADTLHFLHTFYPGPAVEQWKVNLAIEKRKLSKPPEPPVLFRYIVHYEDGESVPVKVRWNEGIGGLLRTGPLPAMGWAEPAWTKRVESPYGGRLAVYAMHWPNPRPEQKVTSVDGVTNNDNYRDYGAPAVLAITAETGTGRRFYASRDGLDSNPGSFEKPWRTLHEAAETLQPGDTVYVRGGYYGPTNQVLIASSGEEDARITYSGYPGETAVFDGYHHLQEADYSGPPSWSDWGFFQLKNVHHVRLQNLTIQRSRRQGLNIFECDHVEVLHNTFYRTAECGLRTYAHWWRGRGLEWSHDIRIYGNTLARVHDKTMHREGDNDMVPRPTTGHEGITIAWTDGFEIGFNEIYGCGKEAIDCKNANSNGRIHHNYLHDGTATGIYLDGWGQDMENMEISENTLHDLGGISVSSEQAGGTLSNIHVHHNLLWDILVSGISVSSRYAGHESPKREVVVEHNTVHRAGYPSAQWGWWAAGITLGGGALEDVTVRDNIATDNTGAQIALDPDAMEAGGVRIVNNLSHPMVEKLPEQRDKRRGVAGENAILKPPQYVNPEDGDFRLKPGSPARNAATDGEDLGAMREDAGVLYWRELTRVNEDFGDPALATAGRQRPVDIPVRLLNTQAHRLGWQGALFNFGLHYNYDFLPLPVGETALSGVRWFLPDHADTSRPTLITLRGFGSQADVSEVRGIPVRRKADALFFLHTYNRGPAARQWERDNEGPQTAPTVMRYVVHYGDGTAAEIPVKYRLHIDQWLRKRPEGGMLDALPEARVAWDRQVWHRWGHRGHESLRLYRMAWENPHPEKMIETLDVVSANDEEHDWGSPAVLGITTGIRSGTARNPSL